MRPIIARRGQRASAHKAFILAIAGISAGCNAGASDSAPRSVSLIGVGAGIAADTDAALILASDEEHGRTLRAEVSPVGASERRLLVSVAGVPANPADYVFQLFVNTGDPTRGEPEWHWAANGRADYQIQGNTTYQSSMHWDGDKWGPQKQEPIEVHAQGTTLEFHIPFSVLGIAAWEKPLGIGFVLMNSAWQNPVRLPLRGQLAQLDPNGRAWNGDVCRWQDTLPVAPPEASVRPLCMFAREPMEPRRAERPEFTPSQGIVIPAYIVPDPPSTPKDAVTPWRTLASSASSSASGDFFVSVVGANRQAPQTLADFDDYARMWDPIREAGGRIFGYVSTCTNCLQPGAIPNYVDAVLVKEQITRWVCGYPQLDGIWIDEFYPKYELAGGAAEKLDFPNGVENAPIDRCFVNRDGSINTSVDVEPAGGYFAQLITWIRDTYPQLRIIGNAGGLLPSNQKVYGNRVDLLVSFEQSHTYIVTRPADESVKQWSDEFGMLNAPITEVHKPQLALIHGAAPEFVSDMLSRAQRRGYSHIYVTDDALPNPWDSVPPYLADELP